MNIIENKILVMAKAESKTIIEKSLKDISDFTIFEADSENKAFELFKQKNAVDQSIDELDKVYKKIKELLIMH